MASHYHAVMYMYNDLNRAEFVLENFRLHNPDIAVSVYNGGQSYPHLVEKYGVELVEGLNMWHTDMRCGFSFSPDWFDSFYGFAEKHNPDFMIFLETDVKTTRKIEKDPKYDLSGPLGYSTPMDSFIVYDYWVNYLNGLEPIGTFGDPFQELTHTRISHKIHTGQGTSVFSRNFFDKTKDNLHIVRKAFKDVPFHFHHDMTITNLARHCGCTVGDWEEATDIRGSIRYTNFENNEIARFPFEENCALIHGWKI